MLTYVLFTLTLLFICNWFQLWTFASAIFRGKIEKKKIKDKWIYETVLQKTGLKLSDITLFKDKRMYGMMVGLPFWPKMILSEGLYKNLNKDELEWVILHEAGHCVLWHNFKVFLTELSFIVLGIIIIYFNELNSLGAVFLAIILSLLSIQTIRWFIEYKADKFSVERVENPKGVITAQDKFRKLNHKNLFNSEKSILRLLIHCNISHSKRVDMANNLLSK